MISIHALREEGDRSRRRRSGSSRNFYPRPPRGGRRATYDPNALGSQFLSTPSARRATLGCRLRQRQDWISIHALREEGDGVNHDSGNVPRKFLSTPSARRATASFTTCWSVQENFYPRPPRGGRRK